MKFIAHRINKVEELIALPKEYGVELDLRDYGNDLVLEHDPFVGGELFEDYLKEYEHGLMILNIKSERIEFRVLELLKKYNISDYFFLDSSFPMIHFLALQGEHNCAIRFSEYEGLDTVLAMKGRVKWVWVDCFSKLPLDNLSFNILKENGFKLCLVSPELQGRDDDIEYYKAYLDKEQIEFDLICTKHYNVARWS
mgnify:CR=1 FL=1|tara:strand:+ start:11136 stop:11723 length:588 start_codon:yes stop_codon:yes gene_type:complete